MTPRDPMRVLQDVLQILEDGQFVSTYKFAVLLGLIDASVAGDALGDSLTTRQLAEHVIALYWPQVRPHQGRVLSQNSGRQGTILAAVQAFRDAHPEPLVRARTLESWSALLARVEWTLIEMPLPKLQRIGREHVELLYRINWSDSALPRRRNGTLVDFDNRVLLLPGVADALVRLAGVLRPFIQQQWAQKVAKLNELPEADLPEFLFGPTRGDLGVLVPGLTDVQSGACFYCGEALRGAVEVDHFLPWSKYPSDDLGNLVAADRQCNNDKRDYYVSPEHIERWRTRDAKALADVATTARWTFRPDLELGAARSIYRRLGDNTWLWREKGKLVPLESARVLAALG